MGISETYRWGTGCFCEKCRKPDNTNRLVTLNAGRGDTYVCVVCLREMVQIMSTPVLYPSPNWVLTRMEIQGWLSKGVSSEKDQLIEKLTAGHKDAINLTKDLIEFRTDRNKFSMDIRRMLRIMVSSVEDYIRKTTE